MIAPANHRPADYSPKTALQKKLINRPRDVVTESLEGLALAYPNLLNIAYAPPVVWRKDAPVKGKVALISGSGSGHEPLNTGYVGRGMLDAACPGGLFTSPTPDQYVAAMHAVEGGAGALFITKNYTGGLLNMGMAKEMAEDEGFRVQTVLVNDDVAQNDPENRRAMGATVLVEKIAGAAAEESRPLDHVAAVAQQVADRARSMGLALTGCTSPRIGYPTFELPADEFELGVGIHGERGRQRRMLASADAMTEMMLEPIIQDLGLTEGDNVLALVSGLGATPLQELFIVFRHLHHSLAQRGIPVIRQLVGNYITSLDMAGCTITLLKLTPELTRLWDAPVHTAALHW
ncbi:MAG: dihydroxyacetone kinase subunit DhaK [Caldilineaceae bacterium]|nr:dihydroxyacetone kinase subunit DhaK [Caldilineaceae bacterium]